jgi:hypothetical protein
MITSQSKVGSRTVGTFELSAHSNRSTAMIRHKISLNHSPLAPLHGCGRTVTVLPQPYCVTSCLPPRKVIFVRCGQRTLTEALHRFSTSTSRIPTCSCRHQLTRNDAPFPQTANMLTASRQSTVDSADVTRPDSVWLVFSAPPPPRT